MNAVSVNDCNTQSENFKPSRIQRKRTKGYKLPPNTVCVTRPGKYGNPFVIGGWYKQGDINIAGNSSIRGGNPIWYGYQFTYTERLINEPQDVRDAINTGYTLIETAEQAVEWFRWYAGITSKTFIELRGKNLACWCKEGACCHADVILEIANRGGEV